MQTQSSYQTLPVSARSNVVQLLDPRSKLIISLLFILSNLALADGAWLGFMAAMVVLFSYSLLGQISLGFLLRRSWIALPFVLSAITLIFTVPGQTIAQLPFGNSALTISDQGLVRFISIVLRSWLSVQMAILLSASTAFPDLLNGLRSLGLPQVLVAVISLMYRYMSVISDEAHRLLRAREARSAGMRGHTRGGSLLWRARVAGNLVGQLFLRSYERSERVYQAMLARGYTGQLRNVAGSRLHSRDWGAIVLTLILLALVQIAGRAS